MSSRLQPLNLTNFTGGLNLRRHEFSLGDSESPDMLNIDVDPRVGFSTRKGWTRWNSADIVSTPTAGNWTPRHAFIRQTSSGGYYIYIADGSTVYSATQVGTFSNLSVTADADPHGADFASWGDLCYIACGLSNQSQRDNAGTVGSLTPPEDDGTPTWNDDYTTPAGGTMPRANCVEAHLGYLFVGGVREDYDNTGVANYPNRLRWSHFNEPEDWAQLDFQDIEIGGGKITALKSFGSVLLIFKEDSVWGLFGYNADSWQLSQLSASVGAPSPAAVTRSPGAIYFYSGASRGGIYAMTGDSEPVHISDPLEQALEEITAHDDTWVGWVDRKLWCCLPWDYENRNGGSSVFVFDPEIGNGAWVCHQPALGELRCPIENSDIVANSPLAVIEGSSGAAAVMELEAQDVATDQILAAGTESAFTARYRTGWKYMGWPDLQKAWLRPRFIVGLTASDVSIDLKTYWDYDESAHRNSQRIDITGEDAPLWDALGSGGSGFDWGDGTLWGSGTDGAWVTRTVSGSNLGWARSVSLEFSTNPSTAGVAWQVSGIIGKVRFRQFTT